MSVALIVGLVCVGLGVMLAVAVAFGVWKVKTQTSQTADIARVLDFVALPMEPGDYYPWYAGTWNGRPAALGVATSYIEKTTNRGQRRKSHTDLRIVLALDGIQLDGAVWFQRDPFMWQRGMGVVTEEGTLPVRLRDLLLAHQQARGSVGLRTRPGVRMQHPGDAFAAGSTCLLYEDRGATDTTEADVRDSLTALSKLADQLEAR